MEELTIGKCSRSLNDFSKKLPDILFSDSWAPSQEELAVTLQQVRSYHQEGRLNTDNFTLYQQRLIASLMALDVASKKIIGDILQISDVWKSCFAMFMARVDSLTVEIIIRDISNILVLAASESKFKIIKDIDSLAQTVINRADNSNLQKSTVHSVRLLNIQTLIADFTDSYKSNSWLKAALKAQIKLQIDKVLIFKNFVSNPINLQSEIAVDSHSFLMAYLKSGHVKNIWVYAKQSIINKLPDHQQIQCEQLPHNHSKEMLILVQIGTHIWIQTDKLESFGVYKLPESYRLLEVLVSNVIEEKCNNHYLFSRKGFWQYKLALSFKSSINFIPRRSDYLTL